MKYAIIGFSLMTFIGLIWQNNKINELKAITIYQRDTINNYNLNLDPYEKVNLIEQLLEPRILRTNDSIYEVQRIIYGYSNDIKIIKVECFKDSSIKLIYKQGSLRNPITGVGTARLVKTQVQVLDKNVWMQFKSKFSKISCYDLTLWDGYLDCIGPILEWDAKIGYESFRNSSTCGLAAQFTEACEFLMRQVNDKDLQEMFRKQDIRRSK
ncbi:MAG: hypothetical protein IPO86_00210 [Saprospiraceae bacterium]|nr:hypothetical protein [Saprospiraceae bacterium]